MKNLTIILLLAVLFFGCRTKTKQTSESEKINIEKGFEKQNDSIELSEKKIQETSSQTIDRVNEMNKTDETETNSKTTVDYDGDHPDAKPLEIVTPSGTTKISGTGKVKVESQTNSRQSISERNEEIAKLAQSKINEANFKTEIKSLTRQLENSQWETIKQKEKTVKVSKNIFWLWFALIVSIVLNFLLAYFWIRK